MKKKTESMQLKPIDVGQFETCSCELDLRKDLHIYTDYIRDRTVKRSVRENKIPKADARRIAKQLSDPEALVDIEETGESTWLEFVEELALALGFTSYDKEGVYVGYSSSSPSFPDNYIQFEEQAYQRFLVSSMQKQEQLIFDVRVGKYSAGENELFDTSIYGRLDTFSSWGCATGVVPSIKFDKVRKFLFDCLKSCKPGVWYETASLVRYLKKKHPFFLIPQYPKYRYKSEKAIGRYCNFSERDKKSNKSEKISEKDRDAFESVEGRFVERFFENIPLTLGYADLAYGMPVKPGKRPSMGSIKAFKINECFLRFMNRAVPEPRVIVQPNHEIHVESQWYPVMMLNRLDPFSDLISSDKICILKLNRMKVIQFMADNNSSDLKKVFEDLTHHPLPPNIAAELDEWAGHSETFILYQDCGLLEGKKIPSFVKDFEVESLTAGLRLVRTPDALFSRLESAEQVPVLVTHRSNALQAPPDGLQSVFTQKANKAKKTAKKELMTITQKKFVTLFFQTGAFLDAFGKALAEEKCFVEINQDRRTVTYAAEQKNQLDAVMKKLKKDYRIKIVRSQA